MKPRYTGPMIVMGRNRGGAYIVSEMDGATMHARIAAFRVIPYEARHKIKLPENLQELIDISADALQTLLETDDTGEGGLYKDRDWNFDGVKLRFDEEVSEDGDLDNEEEETSELEEEEITKGVESDVATVRKSSRARKTVTR